MYRALCVFFVDIGLVSSFSVFVEPECFPLLGASLSVTTHNLDTVLLDLAEGTMRYCSCTPYLRTAQSPPSTASTMPVENHCITITFSVAFLVLWITINKGMKRYSPPGFYISVFCPRSLRRRRCFRSVLRHTVTVRHAVP